MDRWEKPLGLAILEFKGLGPEAWKCLAGLVKDSLRRIDLAARLNQDGVAVLMPDADSARLRRWLRGFLIELERAEDLSGLTIAHGMALARPWEGIGADELVALAASDLGQDNLDAWEVSDSETSDGETATAIAADERNLLFDGFKTLGTG